MGLYDEFVYTLPKRYSQWGDTYASPRAYFQGSESLWNSNLRMGFSVILKETLAEFPHFHHSVEEYYLFSGADLTNFQFYLIDGFIVSANVQAKAAETLDEGFTCTDHNPVRLKFTLMP